MSYVLDSKATSMLISMIMVNMRNIKYRPRVVIKAGRSEVVIAPKSVRPNTDQMR